MLYMYIVVMNIRTLLLFLQELKGKMLVEHDKKVAKGKPKIASPPPILPESSHDVTITIINNETILFELV